MKISIIVPMYNSIKSIDKLIDSVEKQSYNNYELILVDDGSSDGTYDYVKNIAKKNSKIIAYKKENSGPGDTRRFGFKKSTGDLLFFLDSDDWITRNDSLERINDIFVKNKIDILFFFRETICNDEQKEILSPIINFQKNNIVLPISELKTYSIRGGLGTKIFKKSLMKEEFFISTSNFEDFYTTYKYLDSSVNFYVTDEIFYSINVNDDNISLTKKMNFKIFSQCFDILLKLYDELKNDDLKNSLVDISLERCILYTKLYIKGYYERKKMILIINKLNDLYHNVLVFRNNYRIRNVKDKMVFYIFILLLSRRCNK